MNGDPTWTHCRRCWRQLPVMPTVYGYRATCSPCGIRWTVIVGVDDAWVAERL